MRIIKSILFILLIIMAQGIVGFLEYRYLSITLGIFALILIVFVQALQMILEYHIFSVNIKWLPKLFYAIVIIGIMLMNINYLQLSREKFDDEDIKASIENKYQEELQHYNMLVKQYEEEFESYKQSIASQKEIADINHQAEFETYESLLKQYEQKKAFMEKQINNIDSRISTLQKSINRWGATDEDKEKVKEEILILNEQKIDLLDKYNNIIPPEPPQAENIDIEPFNKERPQRPRKDDIKIEKDQRLVILYWLIAGILELGSLALLFLLNNTLNKKVDDHNIDKHDENQNIKDFIKNNKSLIQHNVSMINDNHDNKKENGKVKTNGKSTISKNDNIEKEIKMDINKDILKNLSFNNKKDIDSTVIKNGNGKSHKNNANDKYKVQNESIISNLHNQNNNKENDKKSTNKVDNKQKDNIDNIPKINEKKQIDNNLIINEDEKITNKIENSKKNGKSLISSMLSEMEDLKNPVKSQNENKKDEKIIKEKLINEAIDEIKSMTIYQRKIFAEKLSEKLDKPISFKTLGVWASRNYIPNKKVDIVLETLNQSLTH